jgi:alpha-acetolactate decarboxylase
MFLNDIFALLINSSLIVFADMKMKIICDWLENNQLLINKQKTVAIHFPPSSHYLKQIIEPRQENLTIKVDGYYIDFVNETKLFGAIIDNKLNFDSHTDTIIKKS